LVFADESHFNWLTLRRPYAWSLRGERASQHEFQFRGAKYSLLPAISLDGILHLEVVENAITGADFHRFVHGLLPRMNKWPLPNSVLVVNNMSIHKVAGIHEMVEEHGARLLYLPAYSPDFNPIELAFSTIKAWLLQKPRSREPGDGVRGWHGVQHFVGGRLLSYCGGRKGLVCPLWVHLIHITVFCHLYFVHT
jgi:hypothetical protein